MAGQTIPRGERTWLVRMFTGRDATGKRTFRNETVHGSNKDAQAMLTDLLRKTARSALAAPSATTCGEDLDRWLRDAARLPVRERTLPDCMQKIDAYILPALGDERLSKITTLDVQALYADLLERGLPPRTVCYVHAVFWSARKQAVRWRTLSAKRLEEALRESLVRSSESGDNRQDLPPNPLPLPRQHGVVTMEIRSGRL